MANRQPDEYPRKPDEYPEIMSKMDPLIIRVSATVLLVGSTTYTAKIKLGYKFNGFVVNVTGVGIPIYTEEVDIANASTTNKSRQNGMSDAYNKVAEKATEWMDNLEKSMIDDTKEKNIVDLLREIKYQMHFDSSGHKYPAIIKPNEPGYNEEEYDPRMEVCTEVPTYITDIYKLLAEMNARLNNLMLSISSDGASIDKNKLVEDVQVTYNDTTHGFDTTYIYSGYAEAGLNKRIETLNKCIGVSEDIDDGKSLQTRITDIQNSIGTHIDNSGDGVQSVQTSLDGIWTQLDTIKRSIGWITDGQSPDPKSVISKLDNIQKGINDSSTGAASITNKLDAISSDLRGPGQDTISGAVSQLVAQMNNMNAKIGTPTGTDTLFSVAYGILATPLLTQFTQTDALWLTYWVRDVYGGGNALDPSNVDDVNYDNMIASMKMFFTKHGAGANVNTANRLNSAMNWGRVLTRYQLDPNDKGFTYYWYNGWAIRIASPE